MVPVSANQRRRYSRFSFLTNDTTRTCRSDDRSNSPKRGWSISSTAPSTGIAMMVTLYLLDRRQHATGSQRASSTRVAPA
jgi:hypothetical protein